MELRSTKHDLDNGNLVVEENGGPLNQHEHDEIALSEISNAVERWNSPRINMYRTYSCFLSLFLQGLNDGAYGALIPYLEPYYNLSYTIVSLIFLSPLLGYSVAALLNSWVHTNFGQRGIAFLAPVFHLFSFLIICFHPPYPVLVFLYVFAGFGNGIADSSWNAWVGNLANANEVLGFLHGFYGLGATLAPTISTLIIDKGGQPWYRYYFVLTGVSVVEFLTSMTSFWAANAAAYNTANRRFGTSTSAKSALKQALLKKEWARTTWTCAFFLLGYVGVEVTLGGWIVTFMLRVRKGSAFASSMTATGFWMGITVGRVILGFVTGRLGEKLAISTYLSFAMALELIFWLVPNFYTSAIAIAFEGFFLGPMFPSAVVVTTKLLPRILHVPSIGFAAAIGGCGGAIFPFAVGSLAQAKGVQVLQPFALGILVMILIFWLLLPRVSKVSHQ